MSRLTDKLIQLESETGKRPHVVMEATGNYSKPITAYFQDAGYKVVVLNPLQTHAEKKKSVRKVKTDPIDANRIAQVYYLNEFIEAKPVKDHILELQNLCRQYDSFNTLYTETQLRFRSVLDLVFPKFESVFVHLCSPTALRVLGTFPSPTAILSANRNQIIECLKPAKKSKDWKQLKTDELILAAKESLPFNRAQQSSIRVQPPPFSQRLVILKGSRVQNSWSLLQALIHLYLNRESLNRVIIRSLREDHPILEKQSIKPL